MSSNSPKKIIIPAKGLSEAQKRVIRQAQESKQKALREEKELANLKPGKLVSHQGIKQGVFIGQYSLKDKEGKSLGKIFNVFAAPEDLTGPSGRSVASFQDTVTSVAALKSWHGHDGGHFENDEKLYEALHNDTYKGEWFIPTREMLVGLNGDGASVETDHLYAHKDKGALADTFTTQGIGGDNNPDWYWSCTEGSRGSQGVWAARLADGGESWDSKGYSRMACRPVRLVKRPAP